MRHQIAHFVSMIAWTLALACPVYAADPPDIVFADFESSTYGDWKAEGNAFGDGPAEGSLPGQMRVSGYRGGRLVNSYHGGDGPTGTLTSPPFTVQRKYVAFLIGGGGFEGKTCVNLVLDGKVVRTATGPNTQPGGSEELVSAAWDVVEFAGRPARIEVADRATGGWGHITADHFVFTDTRPPGMLINQQRVIRAERQWLCLPVKNGAKIRTVKVSAGGKVVREFTIEAADGRPDWWSSLDVAAWAGQELAVEVNLLPEGSGFLAALEQRETPKAAADENLYRESLRPQFHFSPARGWNNDPNGLCFYNGEYHLFFQHNPYGTQWGNMHWGHAVSTDLVHWKELGIALYPDALGAMYSGSAVVDWGNSSGLGGGDGKPPLVLIYTAAGADVQCIASSTDGRSFTKWLQNPVVKRIASGNRDPKVIWHEPTKRWVMALYVGVAQPAQGGRSGQRRDTIQFLSSPDLKNWTPTGGQENGFYECPDVFPLPVDGADPKQMKWVLNAASSDYMLGQFDGKTFVPETPKLKGQRGRGFYAAQTYSDLPAADGRRVQVGWLQAPVPGMPFNQAMSVPLAMKLLPTPDGPRLAWSPVRELESLRVASKRPAPATLNAGEPPLSLAGGELLDVRCEFEPVGDGADVELIVRGVTVRYDAQKQELSVKDGKAIDLKAPAPLRGGRQDLIVLADRTCFEVFASNGLTYVPFPSISKPEEKSVRLSVRTGAVKLRSLDVHELRSIWQTAPG